MTPKEFAEHCSTPAFRLKTNRLSVEIERGKVFVGDDGSIDPEHETNRAFKARFQAKQANKATKAPAPEEVPAAANKVLSLDVAKPVQDGEILDLEVSEKRKRHFDAVVQERTAILKELDINKKSGESIPTAAVQMLLSQTLRMFAIGYRDLYERDVQKIGAMANLTAKEIADLRNNGILSINKTYKRAIDECKGSIDSIVMEYSQKLGVGEKAA